MDETEESIKPIKAIVAHADDQEGVRVCSILREAPDRTFEVRHVQSVAECLDLLRTDFWQVVLFDFELQDSRGYSTFEKIQREFPDTPKVLIIDGWSEDIALRALREGAQEYLVIQMTTPRSLVRAVHYSIDRVAHERALRRERMLLQNLMNNIPDRIYFKDLKSRFIRINRACADFFRALSPEDAIGKTDFDYFTPEHAQPAFDDEKQVLESGREIVGLVEKETFADGTFAWSLTSKMPLQDEAGNVVGTFGISHDITRMKLMEDQLEAERERLSELTDQLRDRNRQLEDDLRMAREIQQAFIPRQPQIVGLGAPRPARLVPFFLPASSVGGDFFSFLRLSHSCSGMFLCDVMGHGLRAALLTGVVRGLLEELQPVAGDPSRLMAEMNRVVHKIIGPMETPYLISALYLVVNAHEETIRYANAGHPSPILLERQKNVARLIQPQSQNPGPVLGLCEDVAYEKVEFPLSSGQTLVAQTDGIFEAANAQGAEFGMNAFIKALSVASNSPAEEMFEKVVSSVRLHTCSSEFEDDVCMVAVER